MSLVVKMTLAPRIWRNALQNPKSSSSKEKGLGIHPRVPPRNEAFGNQILTTHQTLNSSVTVFKGVYLEVCWLLCQQPTCYVIRSSTRKC
uniref:Uncharacterized protein n=1 Tax=Arundo donax TaxID=35708 RepID=A0A0A9G5H0_ARUDO